MGFAMQEVSSAKWFKSGAAVVGKQRPLPVSFVHIDKTGSSTLRVMLGDLFVKDRLKHHNSTWFCHDNPPKKAKKGESFWKQHTHCGDDTEIYIMREFLSFPPNTVRYFTILREPFESLISQNDY